MELQHQMAADSLSKMLDRRPTLNELQSQHIYKSPVADKAEHLEHAKAADKLAKALESRVPLAHRFIGVARQRADCRGTLHSDRRNYLLSTLTGLQVPESCCTVTVPGSGERVLADGEVVVLDNTFKHVVANSHKTRDRFVIMAEIWHPGLTPAERTARRSSAGSSGRILAARSASTDGSTLGARSASTGSRRRQRSVAFIF